MSILRADEMTHEAIFTSLPYGPPGFGLCVPAHGSKYGKRHSHADRRGDDRRSCSGCTLLKRTLPEEPA